LSLWTLFPNTALTLILFPNTALTPTLFPNTALTSFTASALDKSSSSSSSSLVCVRARSAQALTLEVYQCIRSLCLDPKLTSLPDDAQDARGPALHLHALQRW